MSRVVNLAARTAVVGKKGLLWLGIVVLVFAGLLWPAVPLGQVALWYVTGGPPLDFDAPRNGQVIAHIDVLGRIAPDISRIRITKRPPFPLRTALSISSRHGTAKAV